MAITVQGSTESCAWPADPQDLPRFGLSVSESLVRNGWCLIENPKDDDMRTTASEQARDLTFESLKSELVEDCLGVNGSGKICHLVPEYLPDSSQDCIFTYDRDVTELCTVLKAFTWQRLGFGISGRTEGMVWMPYSSNREEESLKQKPIDEDDIEDDVVEVHLHFLRRRRLTCMTFIDTDGGQLELIPKGSTEGTSFAVRNGMILVFCSEKMNFRYKPEGDFVILESWVLEDPIQLQTFEHGADRKIRDECLGILQGAGTPQDFRIISEAPCLVASGGGESFEMVWNEFTAGTDGSIHIPHARFDTDVYCAEDPKPYTQGVNAYCCHAAMVDDKTAFRFDNEFFGIPEYEAKMMFPKHRVCLETAYRSLVQAGFTKETLPGRKINVYCGDCGGDWAVTLLELARDGTIGMSKEWTSSFVTTMSSARTAYMFGLTGSVATIDTACSSGLYAYNMGIQALRQPSKDQRTALACHKDLQGCLGMGINIHTSPGAYVANCAAGMLTHKGRCFTYDRTADGYLRGEGCGALYSRVTLDDAEKDGALAINMGSAMNEDGRSASMTAPNGPAQQECTWASIIEGGMTPGEISISECHGTGTPLGDPIEVGALQGVHKGQREGTTFGMTSSKSNLGHQEDNAGLMGLIKCMTMASSSTCAPNCHLRTMNPNLEYDGYPSYFTSDAMCIPANSAIVGVSSFGFGGANAHAEVWARCQRGAYNTGTKLTENARQITITCPITMGQVDFLTGEAVSRADASTARTSAAVLRDPLADYEISRYAYDGKFRLRIEGDEDDELDEDDAEVELPDNSSICVCGSWTAWQSMERLERDDDGWHIGYAVLGETRCESFYACVNGSKIEMRFVPATANASQKIWIDGPGPAYGQNHTWMIDGRDAEVPAGTTYKISFRWGKRRSQVKWEPVDVSTLEESIKTHTHHYFVYGSLTSYNSFQELEPSVTEKNVWHMQARIGQRGQEMISFVRDGDIKQCIYPRKSTSTDDSIPVRGPDNFGSGKYWKVEGAVDDIFTVRLSVVDAHVEVSISIANGNETIWRSLEGWARHDYSVRASWSEEMIPLNMSPANPGVYTCSGRILGNWSNQHGAFVERFQIVIDENTSQCFYPMATDADSGRYITCGPTGSTSDNCWMVRALCPGEEFEVILDLTADDRRKRVMWRWTDLKSMDEKLEYFEQLALADA